MTKSNTNQSFRRLVAGAAMGLLLFSSVHVTHSQVLPMQNTEEGKESPDSCGGPLGSLLAECQSGNIPIDYLSKRRSAHSAGGLTQAGGDESSGEDTRPDSSTMGVDQISPEPPGEFQRLVATSIGKILPVFGSLLFGRVPTTFAPLDRVPVTSEYAIGPGDEVLLQVWGQVTMDLRLQVDRSGGIYIPEVGNVSVSGMQFSQLPNYLRAQLERVFRNFDLSVNMGRLRSVQILVVGHARRPGTYTVSSLSTALNVLFVSGGPSAQGSMRRIQLKRGSQVVSEIDLYDLLLRGDKSGDVRLRPEDVIFIPPVGPQVAVAGSLKNPAIYEMKNEKTVGELIQMAGGLSPTADRKRAMIERITGSSREVLEFPLGSDWIETAVMDGDLFQVSPINPRFENTVTLRGNVANPGRFRWRAGMRLRDIIPDKESLITRDYWKKRNLLGSNRIAYHDPEDSEQLGSIIDSQESAMADYLRQERLRRISPEAAAEIEIAADAQREPETTQIEALVPNINWSYAVIERQNRKDLKTELMPFHLGQLILEKSELENLELQSGDVVTIFSQNDIKVPQLQQTRTVWLEGEFNAPGAYMVGPGETLGHVIERAGGLTPEAYLYGSEFLRESTRRDQQKRLNQYIQDLEQEIEKIAPTRFANSAATEESAKLMSEIQSQRQLLQQLRSIKSTGRIVMTLEPGTNDSSVIAGLALENGDRFIVPSRPSTINVLGAVYNPSAFIHKDDKQLKEYVQRAGGPTRNADEQRMYIIRADGSVVPRHRTPGFDRTELNPGDSIVMPEQILKTTFMMGLRNWSQVVSQFGLGAAAINVLR